MNYADWDAYDLLETLELSGAEPPPDLLAACLARGEEMTPDLVRWLEEDVDESWTEEDPRRFRPIHAGLLLAELRAEEGLPAFEAVYRDELRLGAYFSWFTPRLPLYEDALVAAMGRLAADADAPEGGRASAIYVLEQAGLRSETARPEARAALEAVRADEALPGDLAGSVDEALASLEEGDEPVPIPPLDAFYASGGGAAEEGPTEEEMLEQLVAAGVDPKMAKMVLGRLSERLSAGDADPGDVMADLAREMARAQGANAAQAEAAARRARDAAARGDAGGPAPEPAGTYERETPKYGRNDVVTVVHEETGETQTLKFKHAEKLLKKGWTLRVDA